MTIGLAANLGRRLFGAWGSVSAGLAAALYPAAILYDVRLLSVGLGTLFTVATAYCATALGTMRGDLVSRSDDPWPGGIGSRQLVVGGTGVVADAFLRGSGANRWGSLAAILLGFGLTLGPSTWHNHQAGAGFVPVSLGGGINLYRETTRTLSTLQYIHSRLPAERDGLLQNPG